MFRVRSSLEIQQGKARRTAGLIRHLLNNTDIQSPMLRADTTKPHRLGFPFSRIANTGECPKTDPSQEVTTAHG